MANITTVDGIQYLFDPGALIAVADGDAQAGMSGTVLYGLAQRGLGVNETVDALLQRLKVAAAFAKFTRADGSSILINGKSVSVVLQPPPGQYAPGVTSVIFAGGFSQGVRESLDQVRQAINGVGGKL